jgi:cyclophilin family peptidyl-prolyl cis-trans isomerase
MYIAGPDKLVGTLDDVQVTVPVHYNTSNNRITIAGSVPADAAYRIKLVATRIRDANQAPLDGEFTGTFPSGNHKAGGNFEFQVKSDRSATPVARFSTTEGTMDVVLFSGATKSNIATPHNVAGFLSFINGGNYDNIFVTRDAPGFVVQMGGLGITAQDTIAPTPDLPSNKVIKGEPGNSNVAGTVAFALSGGPNSVNTADNEIFFNLANNDGRSGINLNDTSSGGGPFTVFGIVANSRSFAVLNAINNLNRLNLTNSSIGSFATTVNNVPVNSNVPVTGETNSTGGSTVKVLDPKTDFVLITRVAVLMRVVALT